MGYGYEGERVRLVPMDRDKHLANCQRWLNDPEVTEWLATGYYPITPYAEEQWYERYEKNGNTEVLFAIETLDGRHIGQSGIHGISHLHGTATTGSFIGDSEMRSQGYGTEAAQLRSSYVFNTLGLRMVFSGYLGNNVRSQRMQEKAGYELIGTYPKAVWKLGEFRDQHLTLLTREKWLEMRGG